MLLTAQRAQLNLADDEVARLHDACDSRLEVTEGFVWVTVEGERNDVVSRCARTACSRCWRASRSVRSRSPETGFASRSP